MFRRVGNAIRNVASRVRNRFSGSSASGGSSPSSRSSAT